ncbi:hypothetical protein PR202_gb18552 [Eleusine coracana subsp. coracana]|uniref:Uncharacterized protein n=1 Tax=Eleusine coracana subsp. coracana TaxID=191504 RepID=A0AAV5F5Q0_ELECO|nr:hypothetical protein PR202_gb18552 [Eleusine coracana subsp. coracana]
MGSATAVVEISSDDEDDWRAPDAGKSNSADGGWRTPGADKHPPDGDGWRTPGDVKDKSSDNGLDWAVKLLDGDCDAIGEDLDVSVEMQELWASLIEQTDIVVDAKKSFVDEPEKKRLRDVDDDDDDCVILDGDPEKAVAIAKEDEGPRRDATEDELQIVAEKGEECCSHGAPLSRLGENSNRKVLAQAKASQGGKINPNYVAGQAPLGLKFPISLGHGAFSVSFHYGSESVFESAL